MAASATERPPAWTNQPSGDPSERSQFDNLPEAFGDKNEDDFYTPYLCANSGAPAPTWARPNMAAK